MICAYKNSDSSEWSKALQDALAPYYPQLVPFDDLQELADVALRTLLDIVIIPVGSPAAKAISLALGAKAIPALTVVPVVLWHPDPDPCCAQEILDSTVDDLILGPFSDPAAAARLRLVLRRSWRDLDVNPSSRLPGPTTIERAVSGRIANHDHFSVCYADLDDFKAYNDYYGYFYGDKVIKLCARVIRETVFDHQPDGFVGHIGGDDFVFLIDPKNVKPTCTAILKRFDAEIALCYEARDRRNGYIISKNRRGTPETYSLMTLSIAVVTNHGDTFTHVGEISHMVADLKHYTKTLPGSNFMIERRTKY
ncbi:MAG: diguanylate cyclase [candidate division Zixibacteria bacterium]|nr:diguanylate cyclase [candidate division Zixibacteria bacterium]